MKYFMLDIETLGTDPMVDDVIQIALLELTKNKDGFYTPGRYFNKVLCTQQQPSNEWVARTHKDLLRIAGTGKTPPGLVRAHILEFFEECEVKGPAYLMGNNVAGFDIPFMVMKGYLNPPRQDAANQLTGDYHYRVYELKGAFNVAEDTLGIESKELFKRAEKASPTSYLPKDKTTHDALYDCYKQLNTLNGVIALLRNGYQGLAA